MTYSYILIITYSAEKLEVWLTQVGVMVFIITHCCGKDSLQLNCTPAHLSSLFILQKESQRLNIRRKR